MLRYAHTISSASRRLASRHPMFCDPCTAGPRQFYPLRNNNFQLTDNATRFVAGSSEKSKAYLRTFDVSGRLFQLALSESGLLFSGYNGDYGSSGKTLWEGVTKSDLHMTSESKRITVNGNQHNIKIDKIGNLLCVCNITLNTVTFNGSAFDVYTDPFDVSYRPKSTCVSPLSINGGEAMMEVMMLPDGRINLWNPNYKGNATIPMRGTLIWTV